MKKHFAHINQKHNVSPLLMLLTLLLLFSSCDFRKSLQSGLDLPVTSQHNPSKATLNTTSVCSFTEQQNELVIPASQPTFDYFYPQQQSGSYYSTENFFTQVSQRTFSGWPLTATVDSYILFRQIKSQIFV